jgi:acyl-CoA thioesterase-1
VASASADERPVVLFLGTSLTAGLGVSEDDAYPAVLQQKLDSAGFGLRVVNAGVSGETSAGGLRRLDRLLDLPVRILVLELGANDGLRGLQVGPMRENLQAIVDRTRETYPATEVVLAGMQAPPNLGDRYTAAFREVFADLARENDAHLIPFLLEGVGGIPELNQDDQIHPTVRGHQVIADNVWPVLVAAVREATH